MFSIAKDIKMEEFDDLLEELYKLKRIGIKLGLERIRKLLDKLGNPQSSYKIIHVGGTNGKGSVCRIISSILQEGGYTVGLFTSPHLIHLRERFVVNGEEIKDDELLDVLKVVLNAAKKMDEKPTFFEISTAIAFEFFRRKEVDFAVVEVGMGGRYDATNVVSPIISIITNVAIDHSEYLGNNIEDITKEKAGIIKDGTPVITSATGKALDVIDRIARKKHAELISGNGRWERRDFGLNGQRFVVHGIFRDYELETPLLGRFQGENITLAVLAIEKLQMMGVFLPDGCIERGVRNASNPGRMELVSTNPKILLDGAHNVGAIKALIESLEDFPYNDLILVLGILSDKDINGMIKEIAPLAKHIITTMPKSDRACESEELVEIVKKHNPVCKVYSTKNVREAISKAKEISKPDDLICITGSLYTVGEARAILYHKDYSDEYE